jgi:hypothetical protein
MSGAKLSNQLDFIERYMLPKLKNSIERYRFDKASYLEMTTIHQSLTEICECLHTVEKTLRELDTEDFKQTLASLAK